MRCSTGSASLSRSGKPSPMAANPARAADSPQNAGSNVDRLFQALGDKTRRTILDLLVEQPRSVSQLAAALGVTLTAIGQHLEILEACGLVRTEKLGRVRSCSLNSAGFDVLEEWVREH